MKGDEEGPTETCCGVEAGAPTPPSRCPGCGTPGRAVEPVTVKAMLQPAALMRLSARGHRFCPAPGCRVVYFGTDEVFHREEILLPVLQKEPPGERTVCYCFGITEGEIRRELAETGRSTAGSRVAALVSAGRCACEVRNPQGSCCLGNLAAAARTARAERDGNETASREPGAEAAEQQPPLDGAP